MSIVLKRLVFIVIFSIAQTSASTWEDPDWLTMLRDSDAIVLADIIEGGRFKAQAKVKREFKGQISKQQFWVIGFNNGCWPEDAIDQESFEKGERYYLFLHKVEVTQEELEVMDEKAKEKPEFKSLVDGFRDNRVYAVWTPTAGEIPVHDNRVFYNPLNTSYSGFGKGHDIIEFETFLEESLDFIASDKINEDYINHIFKLLTEEVGKDREKFDAAKYLMMLKLCGCNTFDGILAECVKDSAVEIRFALAQLLGQIKHPKSQELLIALLDDNNSVVQGEAVRQMAKGDSEIIAPFLLKKLEVSGMDGIHPSGIMDPVRNQLDGGKVEIIRTLGKMKYKPAVQKLLSLLETNNEYLLELTVETLEQIESREYIPVLIKNLQEQKLVNTVVEITVKYELKEIVPAMHDYIITIALLKQIGKLVFSQEIKEYVDGEEKYSLPGVIEVLGKLGNRESGKILEGYLRRRISKAKFAYDDENLIAESIIALGELKYSPARDTVREAFFRWYGVNIHFSSNPKLLVIKQNLEREICEKALKVIGNVPEKSAKCIVFLENSEQLAKNPQFSPIFSCRMVIFWQKNDIASDRWEQIKFFQKQFADALDIPRDHIGIVWQMEPRFSMSYNVSYIAELEACYNREIASAFCTYVKNNPSPEDVAFLQFLIQNGLAKEWGVKDYMQEIIANNKVMENKESS